MLYYTPTLDQNCPPWVYASWSIGLFLYQTFDAVDGTQAWVGYQACMGSSLMISLDGEQSRVARSASSLTMAWTR